ncbi:MAG: putative metal-binding motif-containing protein [Deltaproteobacteria bacterium]|nr:putative metal-binding motif-containing protein [Deltaproteobacteria bacterium]
MPRLRLLFVVVVFGSFGGCGDDGGGAGDAGPICVTDTDCSDEIFCNGAERCLPLDPTADSRGCAPSPERPCLTGQTCDEVADRCITDCETNRDADGDGVDSTDCGGDDCDDSRADRFPGNTEICDAAGVDEDCDPDTIGERDADGDGVTSAECCNGDDCGLDCDDAAAAIRPGVPELCDGFDNDCNGDVDDLLGGTDTWYVDADGDGYGNEAMSVMACDPGDGILHSAVAGDCDDGDRDVGPGATETCNDVDDDCDGSVDEGLERTLYRDLDGDGFGDPGMPVDDRCGPGDGVVDDDTDCDDTNRNVSPDGIDDGCDGVDNDCDGSVDEEPGVVPTWYPDMDDDGYGTLAGAMMQCVPDLAGHVRLMGDCDDDPATGAATYPGAPELCDRRDNDCSGNFPGGGTGGIDEREDADDDGHTAVGFADCTGGFPIDDCNDEDGSIFPGATEVCDRVDSDCSSTEPGDLEPTEDGDDDGFVNGAAMCTGGLPAGDCDDGDNTRFPGAMEQCNGVNDDCTAGTWACVGRATFDNDSANWASVFFPEVGAISNRRDNGCDTGRVMIGFDERQRPGENVVGANPFCADAVAATPGQTSVAAAFADPALRYSTSTFDIRERRCPEGSALVGVRVRLVGDEVTDLTARCAPVTLELGGPAVTGTPTTVSGFSGGANIDCPAGTLVHEIRGFLETPTDDTYIRIEIHCRGLTSRE